MLQKKLSERVWSAIVILLLILPSLALSSLWILENWTAREKIDNAQIGLDRIAGLQTLLSKELLLGAEQENFVDAQLDAIASTFPQSQIDGFSDAMDKLREKPSIVNAALLTQKITISQMEASDIMAATPPDVIVLTNLLANQLQPVVIHSTRTTEALKSMTSKSSFNRWDRMFVPVQAGQFKVSADQVSSITKNRMDRSPEKYSDQVRAAAKDFRKRNIAIQSAFAAQVKLMPEAISGSDLSVGKILPAHSELFDATVQFWSQAISELQVNLTERRSSYTNEIWKSILIGGGIIVSAIILILLVNRAFRRRTLEEIDFATYHDQLTGLPNRTALIAKLNQAAQNSSVDNGADDCIALMLVDLVQFKRINDQHSEDVGDKVLKSVASALMTHSENEGSTFRIGGNEFAIILKHCRSQAALEHRSKLIHEAVLEAGRSHAQDIEMGATIGIAVNEPAEIHAETLISDATIALSEAKSSFNSSILTYAPSMRTTFTKKHETARALADAIENDHIQAWLQPQICARTGKLVGAEALVRWLDPETGLRGPHTFLDTAEEFGMLEKLDSVVRRKAFSSLRSIVDVTGQNLKLGINASAQFLANEHSVEIIEFELEEADLSPESIDIEILETVAIEGGRADLVMQNVTKLSERGFNIDLDDFGTGYASMSSLRDLKIDRVKIDRSFVADIHKTPDLQIFTNALIQLSSALGIEVLAEGVEIQDEVDWLRLHGCQYFQGYLFSKPIPEDEFIQFAMKHQGMSEHATNSRFA